MKKLSIAAAFFALVLAGSGFALYEAGAAQHRKPADTAQPSQPSQPQPPQTSQPPRESRPAPQAVPRQGHTAPPDAPKAGQAVPRQPEARNEPDRDRRGPRGGPVVIPYPGWPWWGYPYPYGYPPSGGWRVYADWESANVRLDVSPNDAQVYVDGFYAGVVDEFDGIFQRLTLHAGPHLIEIRKTGYVSLAVELNLYPGQTVTYRRTMEPSQGVEAPAPLSGVPGFEEGATLPPPVDVTAPPGDVRFDVTPKNAEIYADGYYVGIVDDFNGSQHLQLAPGRHHVVLKTDGYETIEVDLVIAPDRSITYHATMKKQG